MIGRSGHFLQELDAALLSRQLTDFHFLDEKADTEELQRLLRLMVGCAEWGEAGKHKVQFYALPGPSNLKEKPNI